MSIAHLFGIAVSIIFINNLVFSRFLGLCPFFGGSKNIDSALGLGLAVIFIMTLGSLFTWLAQFYLLSPLGISYLQTVVFVLILVVLVQFIEMFLQKKSQGLYKKTGKYLPPLTANCAVLGVVILNMTEGLGLIESVVQGISGGLGLMLALLLMSGLQEKLEYAKPPRAMEGLPLIFLSAGLIALAFLGFTGLHIG
jgi:electron transport complex protein RnfA